MITYKVVETEPDKTGRRKYRLQLPDGTLTKATFHTPKQADDWIRNHRKLGPIHNIYGENLLNVPPQS